MATTKVKKQQNSETVFTKQEAENRIANYRTNEAEHALLTGNLETEIAALQTKYSPRLEYLKKKIEEDQIFLKQFCIQNGSEKVVFDSLGEIKFNNVALSIAIKKGLKDEDVIQLFAENLTAKQAEKATNITKKIDKNYLKNLFKAAEVDKKTLEKCGILVQDNLVSFKVKTYDSQS
ncbi:hypothetical protein V9L05_20450 [Bernardetia sp. Wsw4-3y2]|uniref:hypothetical protein n=1 Tax=Bernardetia sp. Wsw4-3y2 TaxID=3127471 RepID=UPI0030CE9FE2